MNSTEIIERCIIDSEGGYKLTNKRNDRGGMTYAGISRRMHPTWQGWAIIDQGKTPSKEMVHDFYRKEFWNPIRGDEIENISIVTSIYDFAINVGTGVAKRMAQRAAMVQDDGCFGPITLRALNTISADHFLCRFALQKIGRYRDVVAAMPDQLVNLEGWLNRSLKGLL